MQSGSPGASGVVLDKAIEAHLAGRIGEAQKLYQSVIDADPADPVALHLLGVSYIQQGQPLQGISFVEQALALRPDDAGMHYNLACALQALNRLDEAIEHYETGLAINPRQAEAHLNLGNALQAQDRHAEAIAHYQDLVICVDSAPAHLSGALGKTTWVLLPFSPDWRWLLARSDCPWYPSARLFRQKSIGDWAEVVRAVGGALSIKSRS